MPKRFRESSLGATIVYLIMGLIVGVAVTCFLIVPNVKNSIKQDAKQADLLMQVIKYHQTDRR